MLVVLNVRVRQSVKAAGEGKKNRVTTSTSTVHCPPSTASILPHGKERRRSNKQQAGGKDPGGVWKERLREIEKKRKVGSTPRPCRCGVHNKALGVLDWVLSRLVQGHLSFRSPGQDQDEV